MPLSLAKFSGHATAESEGLAPLAPVFADAELIMSSYTVFPFKASGVAPVFFAIESEGDAAASLEALRLLSEHPSADRVSVWRDEQLVFSGLSTGCATWLTAAPDRLANCVALNRPEEACPLDCARLDIGTA